MMAQAVLDHLLCDYDNDRRKEITLSMKTGLYYVILKYSRSKSWRLLAFVGMDGAATTIKSTSIVSSR